MEWQLRKPVDAAPGNVGIEIGGNSGEAEAHDALRFEADEILNPSISSYDGAMVDSGSPILTPAFAPIVGGWFTMGTQLGYEDERPPHAVFVDRFELGVCPVTRAEYESFVNATRHELPRDWSQPSFAQADLPVVGVSWIDAVAYCAWRSEQDDRPVRLPTEAEWEFAARGLQEALFPWGDVMPEWIPNGGHGPLQAPWPVTLGEPTDFGLLGISTNVHEWCSDWHDKEYYSRSPERNPAGPEQGVRRAARGGAWRHAHTMCRVTLRSKLDPSFRYNDFGFRLARSL
jgi:formylglycine-generating enzyme required for sulfatase activity